MNKNQTVGLVLLIVGAALGIFLYVHRPVEGFIDAISRSISWTFKPELYYGGLFVAALFVIAGIVRFMAKTKPQTETRKP